MQTLLSPCFPLPPLRGGMMLGLLLCSLTAIGHGRPVLGAALFSALLHMKHIFVYAAPAVAAHLLVGYTIWGLGRGEEEAFSRGLLNLIWTLWKPRVNERCCFFKLRLLLQFLFP